MDSIVWKNKQNCDTLPLNMTMMMMMMNFDFASKLPKTASQHCNLHMCLRRCLWPWGWWWWWRWQRWCDINRLSNIKLDQDFDFACSSLKIRLRLRALEYSSHVTHHIVEYISDCKAIKCCWCLNRLLVRPCLWSGSRGDALTCPCRCSCPCPCRPPCPCFHPAPLWLTLFLDSSLLKPPSSDVNITQFHILPITKSLQDPPKMFSCDDLFSIRALQVWGNQSLIKAIVLTVKFPI